jgi:hypothetical protein
MEGVGSLFCEQETPAVRQLFDYNEALRSAFDIIYKNA